MNAMGTLRLVGMLCMGGALVGPVAAGELALENGSRLEADLASEVLVVATASGPVEVLPETVGLVTPGEVRLKDGRILQGTLVGGRLRARTALGDLTVKVEDLRLFRADDFMTAGEAESPGRAAAAPVESAGSDLPSVALFQPAAPTPAPAPAVAAVPASVPARARRVGLVVAESALYRDALAANPVGRVTRGETVLYLDSIDRRLRIFNTVVLDAGHWIKVRAADGTVGWVPASTLRRAE
jgi:hypothetical protein